MFRTIFMAMFVLSIPAFAVGLILLLFRSKRSLGRRLSIWSPIAAVVSFIGFAIAVDMEPYGGFVNYADYKKAVEAGFTAPEQWAQHQADLAASARAEAAEKLARLEIERKEREAREAAEREAAEHARLKEAATRTEIERAKKELKERECRSDLRCWGNKHSVPSAVACTPAVQRLAKIDHKWTDGWLDSKFSHFRWKDRGRGTITYIGDKIQLQNGFGAWVRHTYECDYDPATERVTDARARPGRIPE